MRLVWNSFLSPPSSDRVKEPFQPLFFCFNRRAYGTAVNDLRYHLLCYLVQLRWNHPGRNLADQSWGRFWGWDPKENGALLIVLWNAIILHSRWGGLIRAKWTCGDECFWQHRVQSVLVRS